MRFLAALILLEALPTVAFAQSTSPGVTLYGLLDAGVEVVTHEAGAGDAQGGTVVRIQSGTRSGTHWGLQGREPIGEGLDAIFVLESGFSVDTGIANQPSLSSPNGRLFGRKAYVGVDGDFGAIMLGRQQTALYDLFAAYDPLGLNMRYSLSSVDVEFNGRADNTIKYSGKFRHITAIIFYSFGRDDNETPGYSKVGRNFGAGFGYTSDRFAAGVAYDQIQGDTIALQDRVARRVAVGGSYAIGNARIYSGFRWLREGGTSDGVLDVARDNLYWIGTSYKFTPVFAMSGDFYYIQNKNTAASPLMFVVTAIYTLSQRTEAYIEGGYVKNKAGSTLGLEGIGSAIPGENQTGATIGLRHRF